MAQITFTNTGGISSTGTISSAKGVFSTDQNNHDSRVLSVISTLTSANTYCYIAEFMSPNLGAAGKNTFTIGKEKSEKNSAYLGFEYTGSGSTGNLFKIGFYGVGDNLVINADGKVGIGTTSPSSALDVNGDIRSQSKTYIGTGGVYLQYNSDSSALEFNV